MKSIKKIKPALSLISTAAFMIILIFLQKWFNFIAVYMNSFGLEASIVFVLVMVFFKYSYLSWNLARTANNQKVYNSDSRKPYNFYCILSAVFILAISIHIIFSTNARREKLLFKAIDYNNVSLVNSMLDKGVDPDIINEELYTPLVVAVDCGSTDIVKSLLNHKANLNPEGINVLSIALNNEMDRITTILIKAGAKTDFKNNSHYQNLYKQYLQRQKALNKTE